MSEWSNVSNDKLGIDCLKEVHIAVHRVTAHCSNFAIQLGLAPDTVEMLDKQYPDLADRLKAVLTKWLRRSDITEESVYPSWRIICSAVASPVGGNNPELAREIGVQHPIKSTVPHSEETSFAEQTSFDSHFQVYGCGCGSCTILTVVSCPNTLKRNMPLVLTFNPTRCLDQIRHNPSLTQLSQNTALIHQKFLQSLSLMWTHLSRRPVLISDMIRYIVSKFNAHSMLALEEVKDHHQLLCVLSNFVSWFNFQLLQDLAHQFLQEEVEVISSWMSYRQALMNYSNGRLEEYEGVDFQTHDSDEHKTILGDIDNPVMKLSDIHHLQTEMCHVFKCSTALVQFAAVLRNGLIIKFCISELIYRSIFPLTSQQRAVLTQLGVSLHEERIISPFGCGCGQCTFESILHHECPLPTKKKLPLLEFDPAHEITQKLQLNNDAKLWELQQRTTEINKMFKKCFFLILNCLRMKKSKLQEVLSYVRLLLSSTHTTSDLYNIEDFHELDRYLSRCVSWFNYELLDELIDEFLKDNEIVRSKWHSYKIALREYANQRIHEYNGIQLGLPSSQGEKVLLLKVDDEFANIKLNDITKLRSAICNILDRPYSLLYLVAVHCSVVTIRVLISQYSYDKLFPLSLEQQQQLHEHGINITEEITESTTELSREDLNSDSFTPTESLGDSCIANKIPSWQDPASVSQSLCEFTLAKFSKRKQFSNPYYSAPFYSHDGGYRLCLKVYANGYDNWEGTDVSVITGIMKGKHDQELLWPFQGDVIVELVNWREDKGHIQKIISKTIQESERVAECTRSQSVYGLHRIISHSYLPYNQATNTQYLEEDCLRIRVKTVVVYSSALINKIPSWQDPGNISQSLCEFTLTEFSKRKQSNNSYFSTPFYTHDGGYKLCLNVYANGYGSSEGTDVSVCTGLMKGEHDQQLIWPFQGDVVLELLNWREDKGHYQKIISFDSTMEESEQVTKGTIAKSVNGGHILSHSSLSYNLATNTQYLEEDCLRVRVKTVVVYSSPLINKIPSWQDSTDISQSLCEFTLTEFSKRRQFNNSYYSTPFYSHDGGYKLCLSVDANGYGSSEGTGLSVFIYLMKGEYDQQLLWPFEGDVIVELVNWSEDNFHCQKIISLDNTMKASEQVTEGTIAPYGTGVDIISHSSLSYNPITNTQYLKEDCLRLRIVAVYSNSLINTPQIASLRYHSTLLSSIMSNDETLSSHDLSVFNVE